MTDFHYVSSHQKHVFWVNISKNTHTKKKMNNSKKLKSGFGIHYLCHHMLLLGIGACSDLHESLSLHRGSHRWQWSASATMERSPLGRFSHPTSTQSAHNIGPMSLSRISNSVWRNVHSRDYPWYTLKEHAQYVVETKFYHPSHLAVTELMLHVTQ